MATTNVLNPQTETKEKIPQDRMGFYDEEFEPEPGANDRLISPLDTLGKITKPTGTLITFVSNPNVVNTAKDIRDAAWELFKGDILGKVEEPKLKTQDQLKLDAEEKTRVSAFNTEANKKVKEVPIVARVDGQIMTAVQLIEILQVETVTAEMVEDNGKIKSYYEIAAKIAITAHEQAQKRAAQKTLAGAGRGKASGPGIDMRNDHKENYGATAQTQTG